MSLYLGPSPIVFALELLKYSSIMQLLLSFHIAFLLSRVFYSFFITEALVQVILVAA